MLTDSKIIISSVVAGTEEPVYMLLNEAQIVYIHKPEIDPTNDEIVPDRWDVLMALPLEEAKSVVRALQFMVDSLEADCHE